MRRRTLVERTGSAQVWAYRAVGTGVLDANHGVAWWGPQVVPRRWGIACQGLEWEDTVVVEDARETVHGAAFGVGWGLLRAWRAENLVVDPRLHHLVLGRIGKTRRRCSPQTTRVSRLLSAAVDCFAEDRVEDQDAEDSSLLRLARGRVSAQGTLRTQGAVQRETLVAEVRIVSFLRSLDLVPPLDLGRASRDGLASTAVDDEGIGVSTPGGEVAQWDAWNYWRAPVASQRVGSVLRYIALFRGARGTAALLSDLAPRVLD
mmetsp:Transcript_31769/g.77777  ORF Transcript_31769/g.77777 Transcript_31769/m.77777 type:complete len:261 (+) Transcript_31769:163-945(+)